MNPRHAAVLALVGWTAGGAGVPILANRYLTPEQKNG